MQDGIFLKIFEAFIPRIILINSASVPAKNALADLKIFASAGSYPFIIQFAFSKNLDGFCLRMPFGFSPSLCLINLKNGSYF
jgi:hypothetical protein